MLHGLGPDRNDPPGGRSQPQSQRGGRQALRRWLAGLVPWIAAGGISIAGEQAGILVTGSVDIRVYSRDGTEFEKSTHHFEAEAGGRSWFIRTRYEDHHWVEYGSDGTNTYQILHDLSAPGNTSSQVRPGLIVPGTYPLTSEGTTALVWWVFCSASSLAASAESDVNFPAPWLDSTRDVRTHALRAEVQLPAAWPPLPERVVFHVARDLLPLASNHEALVSGVLLAPHGEDNARRLGSLNDGFVAGEIEVMKWSQQGSMRLPVDFRAVHRAFPESHARGGWIFAEYLGTSKTVVTTERRGSYLPRIDGYEVAVADGRLRNRSLQVDAIRYRIADGEWPVVLTDEHAAMFEERQRSMRQHLDQRPTRPRHLVWLVLLGLVAISVPLMLSFQRSTGQSVVSGTIEQYKNKKSTGD